MEQHRRRVSTSVVNEVLKEALSWRSPPTTRGGRQGRLYYGTQVASRPPSFTLFVNDPKLFGDTTDAMSSVRFAKVSDLKARR